MKSNTFELTVQVHLNRQEKFEVNVKAQDSFGDPTLTAEESAVFDEFPENFNEIINRVVTKLEDLIKSSN